MRKKRLNSSYLLLFIILFISTGIVRAQDDVEKLKVGSMLEKKLEPGKIHKYSVKLKKDQFFLAILEQQGIDVKIFTYDPEGEKIEEFDSPNGKIGPESITIISKKGGEYILEVQPFDENEPKGKYSLKVLKVEPKATTPEGQIDQLFAVWDNPDNPGAAIAVVNNEKIIFAKGYGSANLEYDIPITPSTIFHIASVSKQFTAFAIAMLVNESKISLDDDIRKYIPEIPDFGDTITINQLIHHTSGLRDQWNLLVMAGWRMDDVITKEQILKLMSNQQELNFKPGEENLYCNTGYTLLAEIVARVTGDSFPDWTKENIFVPLGMNNTLFYDDHEKIVKNRAYSYHQEPGGYKKNVLSYATVGATSLFTTVEDLAKWAMNFENIKVGNEEIMAMMEQKAILNSGDTIDYAFGQGVSEYKGLKYVSHGGGDAGFRTYLGRFPDQQFSVIVFSNLASFNPGIQGLKIAEIYLKDQIVEQAGDEGKEEEEDKESYQVSDELLEEYSGRYEIQPGIIVTFELIEDKFMGNVTGQPDIEFQAVSDTTFIIPEAGVTIIFQRDDEGTVNQLVLYQAGQEIISPKLPPFDPQSVELGEYTGKFYSEELSTFYIFQIENDTLVAKHPRLSGIELIPAKPDSFSGTTWSLGLIDFIRDENGQITGCKTSNGRVRNLYFEKVNW